MNVVSLTLDDLYRPLKAFIVGVTGLDPSLVIQGLPNRTAMPAAEPGFISMTAVLQSRLGTNLDTWDQTDPEADTATAELHAQVKVQLDCYGSISNSWATMLQTLLRDDVGCLALAPTCQPLYTGEPFLSPLEDSEEQYEQRWTLEAELQYDPVTSTAPQFADTLSATVINVEEAYAP
jgi:hypothetical protein